MMVNNILNVDFNYSLKDIPISNKKEYLFKLYDTTSKFVNRLQWKCYYINRDINEYNSEHEENIFKSSTSAPASEELKHFEKGLIELVNNIKFNTYIPKF